MSETRAHNFVIKQVPCSEFRPLWTDLANEVFSNSPLFDARSILSEEERAKRKILFKPYADIFTLSLVAYEGDTIAGWCRDFQTSPDEYYTLSAPVF